MLSQKITIFCSLFVFLIILLGETEAQEYSVILDKEITIDDYKFQFNIEGIYSNKVNYPINVNINQRNCFADMEIKNPVFRDNRHEKEFRSTVEIVEGQNCIRIEKIGNPNITIEGGEIYRYEIFFESDDAKGFITKEDGDTWKFVDSFQINLDESSIMKFKLKIPFKSFLHEIDTISVTPGESSINRDSYFLTYTWEFQKSGERNVELIEVRFKHIIDWDEIFGYVISGIIGMVIGLTPTIYRKIKK